MKDNMNDNTPDRNGDDQPEATWGGPLADYTPQQRRTIQKGLRILARVAIRSYLREHGADGRTNTETAPIEKEEG